MPDLTKGKELDGAYTDAHYDADPVSVRSSPLPMNVLDFRHIAPFQNHSASNATGVKKEAKFEFLTNCKISVMMGEMSE